MRQNKLDLEDFLAQLQQLRKMGPLENLLEMLPGGANVAALDKSRMADFSGKEMARAEAIIRGMTPEERRKPEIINGSRRRRIARGSGTDVAAVNEFYELMERLNETLTIAIVSHDIGFVSRRIKSVVCVNREVVVHPTSELTGESLQEVYGTDIRLVRHDHRCTEKGHEWPDS